jgi:hypothetical protein
MSGKTSSTSTIYYLVAGGSWLFLSLILFITLMIVKDEPIVGLDTSAFTEESDLECITRYDYWHTWMKSGMMGPILGSYFGLVHQHKKYGG